MDTSGGVYEYKKGEYGYKKGVYGKEKGVHEDLHPKSKSNRRIPRMPLFPIISTLSPNP